MGLFDDERLTRLTISVTRAQRRRLGEPAGWHRGHYSSRAAIRAFNDLRRARQSWHEPPYTPPAPSPRPPRRRHGADDRPEER